VYNAYVNSGITSPSKSLNQIDFDRQRKSLKQPQQVQFESMNVESKKVIEDADGILDISNGPADQTQSSSSNQDAVENKSNYVQIQEHQPNEDLRKQIEQNH